MIGINDIRLIGTEKDILRKYLMDRLQIHLRHDPLIGRLDHHIILQPFDKEDIPELYIRITQLGFDEDMVGGDRLDEVLAVVRL